MDLHDLLNKVAAGTVPPAEAVERLAAGFETDLTFARIDRTRAQRQGLPEVIYCPGKTTAQIVTIVETLRDNGEDVLATRATPDVGEAVRDAVAGAVYHATARAITLDVRQPRPTPEGLVMVISAGTSDLPVAEEAALTAERMGAQVERVIDIGVSGLHRMGKHLARMRTARALVVAAGMEGALPSVIGGLIDRPIIAVPTSTGYGANFEGVAPLLSMLNTCAPGISVVNIDNGFGAGVCAALINRRASP